MIAIDPMAVGTAVHNEMAKVTVQLPDKVHTSMMSALRAFDPSPQNRAERRAAKKRAKKFGSR